MATKTKALETEKLYEISDKLFEAYQNQIDKEKLFDTENDKQYRNYVFGVLLHTPNSKGIELIDAFSEDDATHIVNLALRKFRDALTPQVVDF
jgi:hypothetical protein